MDDVEEQMLGKAREVMEVSDVKDEVICSFVGCWTL